MSKSLSCKFAGIWGAWQNYFLVPSTYHPPPHPDCLSWKKAPKRSSIDDWGYTSLFSRVGCRFGMLRLCSEAQSLAPHHLQSHASMCNPPLLWTLVQRMTWDSTKWISLTHIFQIQLREKKMSSCFQIDLSRIERKKHQQQKNQQQNTLWKLFSLPFY